MENHNTNGGYYADKSTMLGPSAASMNSQNPAAAEEPGRGTLTDAPIYGAAKAGGLNKLPTPIEFARSPVGMLLGFGLLAYLGFRYVFV